VSSATAGSAASSSQLMDLDDDEHDDLEPLE
jgi:hypothetical protein